MGSRAASQDLIEMGNRIQNRRREIHLSQKAVAKKAGISPVTVSRIEGGRTEMSVKIFIRLVCILGMDADELLCGAPAMDADARCRAVSSRIRRLGQCEQLVVMRTVEALVEGCAVGLERKGQGPCVEKNRKSGNVM